MKLLNLNVEKINTCEMTKLNGGQYFKPSIDGSWIANERSILLRHSRSSNNLKKQHDSINLNHASL